ncbi:Uu.00g055230.m01.CDS01 [Anthostomella pinea]|uniref:Uu.00g055230.m01.CDS01 n=1 Tax=Anthostomella pinea TaxID=933095 RepID=A0AAI8VY06_9PEZI|nr:Uu.00g055230.m01.CDS01 [Anthostomella pinea]
MIQIDFETFAAHGGYKNTKLSLVPTPAPGGSDGGGGTGAPGAPAAPPSRSPPLLKATAATKRGAAPSDENLHEEIVMPAYDHKDMTNKAVAEYNKYTMEGAEDDDAEEDNEVVEVPAPKKNTRGTNTSDYGHFANRGQLSDDQPGHKKRKGGNKDAAVQPSPSKKRKLSLVPTPAPGGRGDQPVREEGKSAASILT